MSILTYKIKHGKDFSVQLRQAKKLAEFSIQNRQCRSSKDVRQFGLPSAISNQVLRKYGKNKKTKTVHKVNLCVPGQSIKFDKNIVIIHCLGLSIPFYHQVEKVLQAEISKDFVHLSCQVKDADPIQATGWIGIDRNSTGHLVVAALPNGKVMKFGARTCHISKKYRAMRKDLQKLGKTRRLKKIRRRESNIVRDINHKISSDLTRLARDNHWGIKLENLKGIRQTTKQRRKPKTDKQKKDKAVLHSWPFYQFGTFMEYKAKLLGIPLSHVDPRYTSKGCARCGLLGNRNKKQFKCPHCGHVEHADANAAFNIALRPSRDSVVQSVGEWVPTEGSSDSPRWATA